MLTETVNPTKAKDLKDVEAAIAKWEDKSKTLASQFGETLSNGMNMAVLTNMMPIEVQDYVYTHADKDT